MLVFAFFAICVSSLLLRQTAGTQSCVSPADANSANLLSYSAILCAFLGLLQVFIGEAQDAQVLCIALRRDKQQWRIIRFTSTDLQEYKKTALPKRICA